MLLRIFSFLLFQALGAWLGYQIAPGVLQIRGMLAGMLAAGMLWSLYDFTRGLRVLKWLREDSLAIAPPLRWGLWGQVAERVSRAARTRERAARESQQRLQNVLSALQASPNGVLLLDAAGRIEWLNQTAAAHLGLDPARDLQQHLVNLVRNPAFTAYMASGQYGGGVTLPGRSHSSMNPVRLSVQLHEYGEGRRLLLSRDVTMFEQADAMRRDFVANVSHEIRTPLTVLSGFVETLQTLPLQEEERTRYLGLMSQQAERMQALVSDLLMLSRLEGSPPPGGGEWVALPALMRQLQQEAQTLSAVLHPSKGQSSAPSGPVEAKKGGQSLDFEAAPAYELAGASTELHSALSNLVSNAVRYTPADGTVRCGWRLLGQSAAVEGAEFWVQDTGPGIAAEHIPRLTERFYRVDRSRSRETGGTGLGLAIVKHVAQRHGAELTIESTLGQGSRFALLFPANRLRPMA
ncbi:ATP-binding protein [Hylemonella sp. W303a]|uniref:ATP-binding protein n=1 Tax=Hylemonella sp. W303a TaxID=3389873 RepID=UPI00396B3C2D